MSVTKTLSHLQSVFVKGAEAHSLSLFHLPFHIYSNCRVHDPSSEIAIENGRAQQPQNMLIVFSISSCLQGLSFPKTPV